jgi:hypothetical protein
MNMAESNNIKEIIKRGFDASNDLDKLPQDQMGDFPTGVNEEVFNTMAELDAFLHGFQYADDIDAYNGSPFQRGDKFVVRVCVGDWDNEDE